MSKAGRLRELLRGDRAVLAIGAHNGLTARLGEQAGFDAIWASGFEISASHGLPDANLLTMSENLNIARIINEATTLPVIADCDTGYGNAINVQRTAQEYERAGIAAIVIEDNEFPKRCSFYTDVSRELVSVEEHAGKIQAAKRVRTHEDFLVIARTEALIAGLGMEEAVRRANAYADAGADAILVHSRSKKPDEILEFGRRWTRPAPLVAVPTTYGTVSSSDLFRAGYRIVIFANHGLRASVRAVKRTLAALRKSERIADIEPEIASLQEIYDLVGMRRLQEDERTFLPREATATRAIILAAGFEPVQRDRPKCLLDVRGKTILDRQVEALRKIGVSSIHVVRGFGKELFRVEGVRYFENEEYRETSELYSLARAAPELEGRTIVLYGDILFDPSVARRLFESSADISIVVDRSWNTSAPRGGLPDLVVDSSGGARGASLVDGPATLVRIGTGVSTADATGEFVGMVGLSARGAILVRDLLLEALRTGRPIGNSAGIRSAKLTHLLEELVSRGERVQVVDTFGGWMDVDTVEDYLRACRASNF